MYLWFGEECEDRGAGPCFLRARERETRPKVKRKKETEYERGKNRAAKEVRRTIIVRICSHFIFVRRVCSI